VPSSRGRGEGERPVGSGRSVVLFTVAGVEYAIDAGRVRHLVPAGRETGRSVVFEGANYPPVDLRALFRLPAAPRTGRALLVDDGAGRTASLMVDAAGTLARLEERAVTPLPVVFRGRERRRFEALTLLDDRIVVVVSPRGLLADAGPTRVAV